MGRLHGPYNEDFPVGSRVRIVEESALRAFAASWRLHHPLEPGQFAFAGRTATVQAVSFYHGGDELYELASVPGMWHAASLTQDSEPGAA